MWKWERLFRGTEKILLLSTVFINQKHTQDWIFDPTNLQIVQSIKYVLEFIACYQDAQIKDNCYWQGHILI